MPDALDNLLASVDAAPQRTRNSMAVGKIMALSDDGRRATIAGVGAQPWRTEARLWQPRLTMAPAHAHEVPPAQTGGADPDDHDHRIDERPTVEAPPHTHTMEYRVGDVGILWQLAGSVPMFMGGLA